MAYGTVKVDNITFDQGGADQNVTASGIYRAITSGVTVSGTIAGAVLIGTTTVSGTTVTGTTIQGTAVQGVSGTFTSLTGTTTTGTTANFVSGVFTTYVSGATITGTTAQFTSGTFVSLTGTTITGTTISGTTVSSTTGTFTSLTGTTITGTTVNGTTVNSITGNFTSLTGVTVTGTTANFTSGIFTTQVSGLTVTGTQSSFTSGNFVTLSGATATFTSGVIASGTAAAPSLSILGDPNTGIYSPGADQLAISTNGTGRLTIDASGNVNIDSNTLYVDATNNRVGLGTSSPGAGIHIATAGQTTSALDTAGSLNLLVTDTGASAGNGGSIVFGFNSGAGRFAAIKGQVITGGGNSIGHLTFATRNATSDSALTERLRITNDGLVGIGTTSPGNLLHVSGTGAVCQFASSNNNNVINLKGNGTTNGAWLGTTSSDDFTISSGASVTERLRIDSSGRLGLGTSSPTTGKLHIYILNNDATLNAISTEIAASVYPGTDNMSAGKFVNNALGATAYGIWAETTDPNYGIRYAGYFKCAGYTYASSYGLYAENTQPNVGGPGTAYAGYFKALSAGTGTLGTIYGLRVENTAAVGATSYGALISTVSGPTTVVPFRVDHAGSTRFTIDSSGRLLVGTSTDFDSYLNQISSSSGALLSVRRTNSNPGYIKISSGASGDNVANNSQLGYLRWYGFHTSADYEAARISVEVDGTPGANDMPGRLVFSTTADGASSPTERMRITSAGSLLVNATSVAGIATARSYMYSSVAASSNVSTYANQNTALHVRYESTTNSEGASSALVLQLENMAGTTKPQLLRGYNSSNGLVLNADYQGALTNFGNSYGAISDVKFKTDIVDAASAWQDIKDVRVRKYKIKREVQELGDNAESYLGVVAQEIESSSPGLVVTPADYSDTNEENKSVKYSVLYMKAVKALQEAMERIETLEARLTAAGIE